MTLPAVGETDPNPFAGVPCRDCRAPRLRLEWRAQQVFTARPLGSYSVAGAQLKASVVASAVQWPWCVCDGCGAESKGKRG